MGACSAFKCRSNSSKRIPGVTFHRFPKSEELKAKWVKAIRRKNWLPSRHSYLCSKHFTEEVIDRTSVCCVRLRENAVPTIFEIFTQYLKDGFYCQKRKSKNSLINQDHDYWKDQASSTEVSEDSDSSDFEAYEESSRKSSVEQTSTILKDHNSSLKITENSGDETSEEPPGKSPVDQEPTVLKDHAYSSHSSPMEDVENSGNPCNEAPDKSSINSSVNQKSTIFNNPISSTGSFSMEVSNNLALPNDESSRILQAKQGVSILKDRFSSNNNSSMEISNNPIISGSFQTLSINNAPIVLNSIYTNYNSFVKVSYEPVPCTTCQKAAAIKEEEYKRILQEEAEWKKKYQKKINILHKTNSRYKKRIENLEKCIKNERKTEAVYYSSTLRSHNYTIHII